MSYLQEVNKLLCMGPIPKIKVDAFMTLLHVHALIVRTVLQNELLQEQ